jgi:hypothetical protein
MSLKVWQVGSVLKTPYLSTSLQYVSALKGVDTCIAAPLVPANFVSEAVPHSFRLGETSSLLHFVTPLLLHLISEV